MKIKEYMSIEEQIKESSRQQVKSAVVSAISLAAIVGLQVVNKQIEPNYEIIELINNIASIVLSCVSLGGVIGLLDATTDKDILNQKKR